VKLFHEALDPTASVGKIPNGSDRAAGVPAQAEMPQTNRPRSRKAGPALTGQSRDLTHRELGRAGSPFGTRGKLLRHGNPLEQRPMRNACRSIHIQDGHPREHETPSSLRCRLQPSKDIPPSSGGDDDSLLTFARQSMGASGMAVRICKPAGRACLACNILDLMRNLQGPDWVHSASFCNSRVPLSWPGLCQRDNISCNLPQALVGLS